MRDEAQTHLILNYRPLGLVRATASQLDTDGLTVDTGCILLPPHSAVEITLSFRDAGRSHVRRLAAEVTSSGSAGTRLRFIDPDPESVAILRDRILNGVRLPHPRRPFCRTGGHAARPSLPV